MGCAICAKHRGEGPLVGPLIWQDDLLVVTHRPVGEELTGGPGHVFVETRRHVASLADLAAGEVDAVARAVWLVARGLRAALNPEYVFSAVVGRQVAHFHQHVFVRHRGTPDDVGWMDGHLWPGAPRVSSDAIVELCGRLRGCFT